MGLKLADLSNFKASLIYKYEKTVKIENRQFAR